MFDWYIVRPPLPSNSSKQTTKRVITVSQLKGLEPEDSSKFVQSHSTVHGNPFICMYFSIGIMDLFSINLFVVN